jgi:hypothetical protein
VDAAKAAVAHYQHLIASARGASNLRHQAAEILFDGDRFAQGGKCLSDVPAQIAGVAEDQVGISKTARQQILHHPELHGVRAWFKDSQDAAAADLAAQAAESRRDRCRVVGKIVVYGDAAGRSADLKTPLDIPEARQRRQAAGQRHAGMSRRKQCSDCVAAVVCAAQTPVRSADQLVVVQQMQ